MFSSKQSDYWYSEVLDEFLVCTITSVSAEGPECKGDLIAHYPIIYSLDRYSNQKRTLYPTTSTGQLTSEEDLGYVYAFVPNTTVDINITSISKPLISYNEKKDLYNIVFTGRYDELSAGLAVFNYTFQYTDKYMVPVDTRVYLPQEKNIKEKYTFENGYLNPNYFLDSSDTSSSTTFFGILTSERPPNYRFRPYHNDDGYLVFNTITYPVSTTQTYANSTLPIGYSAGYIAQKGNSLSFRTDNCIRVDFTCKSYIDDNQIGFLGTKNLSGTSPVSSCRYIPQYVLSADVAEGFGVFFYEPGDNNEDVLLRGVGSSFGYVPTAGQIVEQNGFPFEFEGISLSGFACVVFDINGNFCTSTDIKEQGINGITYTQAPSTIGIRGGIDNDYKVISRSTAITGASAIEFVEESTDETTAVDRDFRVELVYGREIIVSGKLSSDSEYTVLYNVDLTKINNYTYKLPPYLKAGLVSSTGTYIHNFKLKSFRVSGISQ